MFDRLKALVNRISALGTTEWDDNKVAMKMLRTYRAKNNILASVIMERPSYDEMTPQEVLSKLKHHECLDEDAINAHNQNSNEMGYNKNATLKAT
jgi:predicted phosphatase